MAAMSSISKKEMVANFNLGKKCKITDSRIIKVFNFFPLERIPSMSEIDFDELQVDMMHEFSYYGNIEKAFLVKPRYA